MAISRAQLLKELLPGLNALFGMEYARYDDEHSEIYETESSDRSFEEEVITMLNMHSHRCRPSITTICVRTILGCLFLRQIVKLG